MHFTKTLVALVASLAFTSAVALPVENEQARSETIISALHSRETNIPRAVPGELKSRQLSPIQQVEMILEFERAQKSAAYSTRRKTEEQQNPCASDGCKQCRDGRLTVAIAEVFGCGAAALAVDALTAGTTTILELTGFYACETSVVGNYYAAMASCKTIV